MCTLSIFPDVTGTVVTMSRDEAEDRLEGAPMLREHDRHGRPDCWYGVDAATGGSWFGVNQVGLVAVLLNRYQEHNPGAQRSRGVLVPGLLEQRSLTTAMAWAQQQPWQLFAPCDVLVLQRGRIGLLRWNGQQLAARQQALNRPLLRTSSSLDYPHARAVRVSAFQRFRREHHERSADQVLLDLHGRPDKNEPEFGILMQRQGRHSKSICQAVLDDEGIRARYRPRAHVPSNVIGASAWDCSWP